MKRGLMCACAVCAAVGAMLAGAAGAKADSVENFSYNLSLAPTESTTQPATPVTLHLGGTIQWKFAGDSAWASWYGSDYAYSSTVTVSETKDGTPVTSEDVTLNDDGTFVVPAWSLTSNGVYAFTATTDQWKDDGDDIDYVTVTSNLVTIYVGVTPPLPSPAQPRGENSIFLCYSTFQVDPGVWPYHIAQQLLAGGGYWVPFAVKGNVPFGTNIGGYHLVCNLATGQAAGQQFAGDGGDISGPEAHAALTGQLGWYPVVP